MTMRAPESATQPARPRVSPPSTSGASDPAPESPRAVSPADSQNAVFLAATTVCLTVLFGLLVGVTTRNGLSERAEGQIYLLFFGLSPLAALLAAFIAHRVLTRQASSVLPTWAILLAAVPVLAAVAWGLQGIEVAAYHLEYRALDLAPERFAAGVVGTVLLLGVAVLLARRQAQLGAPGRWAGRAGLIVGTGILLALFDVTISPDTLSYSPYLGSAVAVLLGDIPLVDVFSQYGFNFLIFSVAMSVLPWSYYSASLVVAALNAVYWALWGWICAGVSRSRLHGLVLGALGILCLHAAAPFNVTYTPSMAALRFLPPSLLLLALVWMPPRRTFTLPSVAALMLAAVWSLESLLFTLLTYLVYVGVLSIARHRSLITMLRASLRSTVFLAGCVVLPHLLLVTVFLLVYGALPRYDIYLELVGAQGTDQAGWEMLVSPRIRTWALFGYAYATTLCFGLYTVWQAGRRAASAADPTSHRAAALIAVAAYGMLQFSYYVGRSSTPSLFYVAFPLLCILVALADFALQRYCGEKLTVLPLVAGITTVLAFAAIGGVFADRFGRPFDQSLAPRSHASFLRACLVPSGWTGCSPEELGSYLHARLYPPPGYPPNETGGSTTRAESLAAYQLLERWQADEPRVLPFVTDAATVLFHLHKAHRLRLPHPMVDGLSPTLTARALAAASRLPAGTVLVVGLTDRSPIDRDVLAMLRQRWQFCAIESIEMVTAFELRDPAEGGCQQARHP